MSYKEQTKSSTLNIYLKNAFYGQKAQIILNSPGVFTDVALFEACIKPPLVKECSN